MLGCYLIVVIMAGMSYVDLADEKKHCLLHLPIGRALMA